MKKIMTIAGILLMSSTVFAHPIKPFLGEYSIPSSSVFYDYTEKGCKEELGRFESYQDGTEQGICIHSAQNTIKVQQNRNRQGVVSIEVIWGKANRVDFKGVVTEVTKNKLTAKEAILDDEGVVDQTVKNGCELTVTVEENKALLYLSKTCDYNLGRADEAVKK